MTTFHIALGVGFLITVSTGLLYGGLHRLKGGESLAQRLERLSASSHPSDEAELDLPFTDRVLKPWLRSQIQAVGRLAPSRNIEKLRRSLVRAGYPHGLTVLDFLGIKLLITVLLASSVLYLSALARGSVSRAILTCGGLAVLGFFLPDFWLGRRVRKRQKEIARTLPDALDMLTICVDAGAGLVSAMLRISQKWNNALGFEFGKVVAEINIGMTRRQALESMATRTDVTDVRSFVAVLMQADQFGLSIAKVLHTQSDQMRVRRWQRAEEEARKVPLKLLFPLVFMIFPAMIGVSIGPSLPLLLEIMADFAG